MRTPIAIAGLLASLVGCAVTESPDHAGSGESAMFREDPAHAGVALTEPVDHFGAIAWSYRAKGAIIGSPVVSSDVVYIAGGKGELVALKRASGRRIWSFDTGATTGSTPAVAADRVYLTTREGSIHAVDAANGSPLWTYESGPAMDFPWGHESGDIYVSSPVPDGGEVLFGSPDGSIYCLRAADGSLVWQASTGGRISSTPAVADGRVYVGSADGLVYAFDRSSGEQIWTFETLGASLQSGEFGYDRRTVQSSPAVRNGRVYVGARDGFLYALDAATGREVWSFDHDITWINASPAVTDSLIYAATSDGQDVHAFNALTGDVVWRTETPGIVWGSPTVAGNLVYVGTSGGVVLALNRHTGAEVWRFAGDDQIFSTPAVDDGMLFTGLMNGRLLALSDHIPPLRRTVFRDDMLEDRAVFRYGAELKAYLEERGYAAVGLDSLEQALAQPEHHVIVFAVDYLPESHTESFRRFLEGGGKVVWAGLPPHILMPDDPGNFSLLDFDRSAPGQLLGVSHDAANFGSTVASPTEAGRRWGLDGSWKSGWSVRPEEPDIVLATDDMGLATAWLEEYGGPPGSGFLRIEWAAGSRPPDSFFESIRTAAETWPVVGAE